MNSLAKIVRRLHSSSVANTASKEELCLSLAALSRLYTRESVANVVSPAEQVTLESRVRRVARLCSPQEISMISEGASAMRWSDTDLMDLMAGVLYSNDKATVASVSALVQWFIHNKYYASVTVRSLILRVMKKENTTGQNETALPLFARYLGRHTFSQLCTSNDKGTSLLHANSELFKERDALFDSLRTVEEPFWGSAEVKVFLYDSIDKGTYLKDDLVLLLLFEKYVFFRLKDQAARDTIEEAIVDLLSRSNSLAPRVRDTLVGTTQFPAVTNFFGAAMPAKSLVSADPLYSAYVRIASGASVDASLLMHLRSGQVKSTPETHPFSGVVYTYFGQPIPTEILEFLQHHPTDRIEQMCALLLAARLDRTGVLAAMEESVLGTLCEYPLSSLGDGDLASLATILNRPESRFFKKWPTLKQKETDLKELVKSVFLSRLGKASPSELLSWIPLLKHFRIVHVNDPLVAALADKVRTTPMSVALAIRLLRLFKCIGFVDVSVVPVVCDYLMPQIHSLLNRAEGGAPAGETSFTMKHLVEILYLQLSLDLPSLRYASQLALRSAERRLQSATPEDLLVISFSALMDNNEGMCEKTQEALLACSDAFDAFTAEYVTHFLCELPYVNLALLVELRGRLEAASAEKEEEEEAFQVYVAKFVALYHRVRLANEETPSLSEDLLHYVVRHEARMDAPLFAMICEGAPMGGDEFCCQLISALWRHLDGLTPSEIATCIDGLGEAGDAGRRLAHQVAMEIASDYVVDNVDLFLNGPDICKLLKGFAALHCTKRSLYATLSRQLNKRAVAYTMDRSSVAIAMNAFGGVKFLDEKLIDRLVNVFLTNSDSLNAPDILMAVKGSSRLLLHHDAFYEEMGKCIAKKVHLFPFAAQCTLLKSYGDVGVKHDEAASAILQAIVPSLRQNADANTVVDILKSTWLMDYTVPPETLKEIGNFLVESKEQLDAEHILVLCSVMVDTNWRSRQLIDVVTGGATTLLDKGELPPVTSRAVLDTLSYFSIHNTEARKRLSPLARTASKEVVTLSEAEQSEMNLLLTR